jgi:tRNA threonylcarbamoyl adenosine modification protein YeaZ
LTVEPGLRAGGLVFGVDTCGPSGSVALGRLVGDGLELLGQTELAGRSYSATLVAAVGELLKQNGMALRELSAIVVVNGPGSFTGVRVGLSAVKGLAEPFRIPVVVVSRLEVLASKAGTGVWRRSMRIGTKCFCGWKWQAGSRVKSGRRGGACRDVRRHRGNCGLRRCG